MMREACSEESRRSWRIQTFLRVMLGVLWLVAACGRGAVEPEMADQEPAPEAAQEEAAPEKTTVLPGEGMIQEENLPPEGTGAQAAQTAHATIEARSGSNLSGTATFEAADGGIRVNISLAGVSPGEHGIHIHAIGDCSAPDASSAGGHFNPTGSQHGSPDDPVHHAGDLGNITIGSDGRGTLTRISHDISLDEGPNAIRGLAIVVHEKADDFTSQPSGAAGARIGCGVIR